MRELLAHVAFRGAIRERSVEPYLRLFERIGRKRRIKGLLFDISSGGGEVVASKDLYLGLRRLNERIPVVASIGGVGASGAYLAALGARRLFAYPESQVGSIGVVYPHLAVRDLLRRMGIAVDLIHAGEHKDAFQGYRPLTDVERAKVQALADEDHGRFVAEVAAARRRPVAEIAPLATGEFWSGARALELGLVDALGDRGAALDELSRLTGVPRRKVVRVEPPRSLFDRLVASGSRSVTAGIAERLHDAFEESVVDFGPALRR
jgi:protease-4